MSAAMMRFIKHKLLRLGHTKLGVNHMQTSSQLIHHNQAIIPDPVLEALKLREGDSLCSDQA